MSRTLREYLLEGSIRVWIYQLECGCAFTVETNEQLLRCNTKDCDSPERKGN